MSSPHTPQARRAPATTVQALTVLTVCAVLFTALRYTRPHDLTGALLLLGVFLVLGSLIVLVRRASRRDPLVRPGPGCAQETPSQELCCSLPAGHHGAHIDRRTNHRFQDTLTGLVSGATFYRDANGRREIIHDAF